MMQCLKVLTQLPFVSFTGLSSLIERSKIITRRKKSLTYYYNKCKNVSMFLHPIIYTSYVQSYVRIKLHIASRQIFSTLQRSKGKHQITKNPKDSNSAMVAFKMSTGLITKETIYFDPDLIVPSLARTQNTNFAYLVYVKK